MRRQTARLVFLLLTLGCVASTHASYGHLGPDWAEFFYTKGGGSLPDLGVHNLTFLTGLSLARTGIITPNCHLPQVVLEATPGKSAAPDQKSMQPTPPTRLKTEYRTLAESLQEGGYATGHFGKWHLGAEPSSPLQQGFDIDVPHHPGPGPAGSYVAPWKFKDFDADPGEPNQHIEDRMAKEAVAWMEKNRDRPFYLNYWMFSVHALFDAKKALIEKHRARVDPSDPQRSPTCAAMIQSEDYYPTLLAGLGLPPAPGDKAGIVRLFLLAQDASVELDWIELTSGGQTRRWDF